MVAMIEGGLEVGLNSDDPSVFEADLNDEFHLAQTEIGLTDAQLDACTASAIEAAFLSDQEKSWLRELVAGYGGS